MKIKKKLYLGLAALCLGCALHGDKSNNLETYPEVKKDMLFHQADYAKFIHDKQPIMSGREYNMVILYDLDSNDVPDLTALYEIFSVTKSLGIDWYEINNFANTVFLHKGEKKGIFEKAFVDKTGDSKLDTEIHFTEDGRPILPKEYPILKSI